MATSKSDLDALIKKAKVDAQTAKRLHEANGTSDEGEAAPARRGGHGASVTEMPNFGDI